MARADRDRVAFGRYPNPEYPHLEYRRKLTPVLTANDIVLQNLLRRARRELAWRRFRANALFYSAVALAILAAALFVARIEGWL